MTPITVVIPTRNRGAQAAEAAQAVLRDPGDFELVVIDQSTNEETANALRPLAGDSRLRVVRSDRKGLSVARNTGVAEARAPIVAFTDDDCRPEAGWPTAMLRVFQEDPEASLVFGRVRLPPEVGSIGYAASFEPTQRVIHGGIPLPSVSLGVGANFAIRREVHEALGGFDPFLGPGTPHFRAGGEETDLLIRALHRGYRVVNAPECDVLHLGVRVGADIRKLAVGYQLGTGAAFGKLARLTGPTGLRDLTRWAAFYASSIVSDVVHLRRPRPGVLCYFIAGAAMTFRYGIDRERSVFQERRLFA
jgi:glycosyltransferase involved in cell wall biosynthesis